jgi:hypothetical protein
MEQWLGVSDLRDWHEFSLCKPESLVRAVQHLNLKALSYYQ